jgi:hypothetical protein
MKRLWRWLTWHFTCQLCGKWSLTGLHKQCSDYEAALADRTVWFDEEAGIEFDNRRLNNLPHGQF